MNIFLANLYKRGETEQFENIECDWPLFCCFLVIDGIFKNIDEQIREYKALLFNKLLRTDPTTGDYLIPNYYYVSCLTFITLIT